MQNWEPKQSARQKVTLSIFINKPKFDQTIGHFSLKQGENCMQYAWNCTATGLRQFASSTYSQIVLNAGKFDFLARLRMWVPPHFVFPPIFRLLAMKVESQMLQLPLQLHNNNNNNNSELLCEEYYIKMRPSRTIKTGKQQQQKVAARVGKLLLLFNQILQQVESNIECL